jgi:hypothetical protein
VREELRPSKSGSLKLPSVERRNERSGAMAMPSASELLLRGDESGSPTIEEKAIVDMPAPARAGASSRAIWIAIALVLLGAAGIAVAHYLGFIK